MITSYPASPRRIIVLLKTLQHIIENLNKKKWKIWKTDKKEVICQSHAINKKYANTFRYVITFLVKVGQSWINSMKLAEENVNKGFAFELKCSISLSTLNCCTWSVVSEGTVFTLSSHRCKAEEREFQIWLPWANLNAAVNLDWSCCLFRELFCSLLPLRRKLLCCPSEWVSVTIESEPSTSSADFDPMFPDLSNFPGYGVLFTVFYRNDAYSHLRAQRG